MGEEQKPVTFYVETAEGEYHPLPLAVPDMTLPELEDAEMSNMVGCRFCKHSDQNRQKDEKIRCKRFSQWVAPLDKVCGEYTQGFSVDLTESIKEFFAERSRREV